MTYYLLKLFLSAGIIVAVSEIAKTNANLGALINSLPLISVLSMLWLYFETHDTTRISQLAAGTFWLVLPTLPLFLVLPALLKAGWTFLPALGVSVGVMLVCYVVTVVLLGRFGISI